MTSLSFDDRFSLLVDREQTWRENRRLTRLLSEEGKEVAVYLTAGWSMHVMVERRWRDLPLMLFLTWWCIDGCYALYWWLIDPQALILYRVMRQRLSAAETGLSPERALDQLRRIQQHQIRINKQSNPISGISKLSDLHHRVFAALELKKPTQPQQLSLL